MSDKFPRILTGLAVLAVAVIAAAVSFAHIDALALAHGYTRDTARLLPLSVDGLIVASSMVLLTEARAQRRAPRLARFGLVLGIAGTLAANVAYGVHFGPVGAVVNAWPAAAFITATEILVGQMRRAGTTPAVPEENPTVSADADADAPEITPAGVAGDVAGIAAVDAAEDRVNTPPLVCPGNSVPNAWPQAPGCQAEAGRAGVRHRAGGGRAAQPARGDAPGKRRCPACEGDPSGDAGNHRRSGGARGRVISAVNSRREKALVTAGAFSLGGR